MEGMERLDKGGRMSGSKTNGWMVVNRRGRGWMYRRRVGWRRERWSDGGGRVLAIILHRFTLVRDGWMCNEVWDLGVSTCTWLSLIALWVLWDDVTCVCVLSAMLS